MVDKLINSLTQLKVGDTFTARVVDATDKDFGLSFPFLTRGPNIGMLFLDITPAPIPITVGCRVSYSDRGPVGTVLAIDGDEMWLKWDTGNKIVTPLKGFSVDKPKTEPLKEGDKVIFIDDRSPEIIGTITKLVNDDNNCCGSWSNGANWFDRPVSEFQKVG